MRTLARICFLFFVTCLFSGWVWADNSKLFCQEQFTTIMDLSPGSLLFPDGTNFTDQFRKHGVIFSADDIDLPPEFQRSMGWQENRIQDHIFWNLFRLNFTDGPIVSVSVTFRDQSGNPQVHTLTAFDRHGNLVDSAKYTDISPERFTLAVSSCKGIAFVVAIEDPLGAEWVERITFTKGKRDN